MPSRSAGGLVVRFDAGTAQFFKDTENVEGRVKAFGATTRALGSSMGGARLEIQSASAATQILEGRLGSGQRAVGRFLADTLKLGPALAAAFPVVGALAFAGVLVKIGEGVYKFFEDLKNAPEKINQAFRPMIQGITTANDELRVANDKLINDIAKLEGKRQNNVALALDEARVAADKLAESIDKDYQELLKLQAQQSLGAFKAFIVGATGTGEDEELTKGYAKAIDKINAEGQASVRAANSQEEAAKAQAIWNQNLNDELEAQIDHYKTLKDESQRLQDLHKAGRADPEGKFGPYGQRSVFSATVVPKDQSDILSFRTNTLESLEHYKDLISLRTENLDLTQKDQKLRQDESNEGLEKPFENRLKLLQDQLKLHQAELGNVSQPETIKLTNEAIAETLKIYDEINKILEKRHVSLTDDEKSQLQNVVVQDKLTVANNIWEESLNKGSIAAEQRIDSLGRLSEALNKGYKATLAANVANDVQAKFGEKLKDRNYLLNPLAQVEIKQFADKQTNVREAEHGSQIVDTTQKLNEQIQAERAIAAVRSQGEFAVKQAELGQRILELEFHNTSEAVKEQVEAMKKLNEAQLKNEQQADLGRLGLEADALTRLTKATLSGADAIRQANLQKQITENVQKYGVAGAAPINARAIGLANEQYQLQLAGIAIQTDKAKKIDEEIQNLERAKALYGDSLGIQIALRDLQNQRLKAWADELLEIGTLKAGIQAFFLSMEEDAKKPGVILYEGLHDAVSKTADELTKLFTGQKASFGKLVQNIGVGILRNTIQSGLQTAIGAIGRRISHPAPVVKGPLGTYPDPFYVWVKNMPGDPNAASGPGTGTGNVGKIPPGTLGKIPPPSGGGGGGTGGTLGRIFGGILGGIFGGPQQGRASGGDVSPGGAYLFGERGPEPFFAQTSGTVLSNDLAKRVFGGGGGGENGFSVGAINVNGADPALTRQSIFEALSQVHQDSISQSVRAGVQRSARVPPGR